MLVYQWIGISTDEYVRVKDSRLHYTRHRYPLIDDVSFSRGDCKAWFAQNFPGRELPRSACCGCPYRTDAEWDAMKRTDPVSWADAVEVDELMRLSPEAKARFDGEIYLHKSLTPLGDVDLKPAAESPQLSLFDNECEGMCGV